MLDLTNGSDFLRQQFSGNRRRGVNAAINAGVKVGAATTLEEFQAYHKIHVNWCSRKNLVPTPFDILEKAFSLTNSRSLFLAHFDGEVIAGVVVRHCPKGIIEYAANSSLWEKQRLKPNDLLHWEVIQWACREGYTGYSLGGTHLFLRQMGGTIVPVYRYRLDRTRFRQHERRETLQKSGKKIFRRLPQGLQNQVKQALRHG
jgi:serine/alanine adding enzyme